MIVQSFETSRYLGAEYDAKNRIRTIRYAQRLSAAIYLLFIGLSSLCRLLPTAMPRRAKH